MSEMQGRHGRSFPRTKLGKQVAEGAVSIDNIFESGKKIKESEIVAKLIPNLQTDIILVGGSPGKGGGSRRTPTRRTARMHRSGRRYRASAMVLVGDGEGHLGIGKASSKENKLAMDKALEQAKLNVIPIKRGCGSWECSCGGNHSIPVETQGKSGSVRVILIPAPKGIGLCVNDEAKKILRLAGVKDVWTKCFGQSRSRINYAMAVFDALKRINQMKGGTDAKASKQLTDVSGVQARLSKHAGDEAKKVKSQEKIEAENIGEDETPAHHETKQKKKETKHTEESKKHESTPSNDAQSVSMHNASKHSESSEKESE